VGELEAVMLARIGVGELVLVDYDELELSNLNRNPYSTRRLVGRSKVGNMAELIASIDPKIRLNVHNQRFSFSCGPECLAGCDVVMQAVDDMVSRVIVHRVARECGVPCVTMSGAPPFRLMVTTFLPDSVSYEKFLSLPTQGLSDDELDDGDLLAAMREAKNARVKKALVRGALLEWGDLYLNGQRRVWAVTPERPYITAAISVRQAVKLILGQEAVSPPRFFMGDLDEPVNVLKVETMSSPPQWTFADF
jgi:molybdopterin/thiamine biosynthesis adenylyltransferase